MNQPIPDPGVDRRGGERAPYRPERLTLVRKIAALASAYRGREGLVIGIEGPWGAGKTPFTGYVVNELRNDPATVLLPFNPWSLSDHNALTAEFVSALSGALADDSPEPRAAVSYAARLRATAARSLRLAPRGPVPARTPQDERGTVQQKLASIGGRLVVIIEDIDRLDAGQTRLLMKLVRIAASLPNLVFLLVYDRPRVASSLDEEGRTGEDVLKTLVHIAFTLPEPTRQELNSVLFAQLREAVGRANGEALNPDHDERWRGLVHDTLPPLFGGVADIAGFASSLRLAWSAVGIATVDMSDFAGVEAVRYFAPQLYAAMASNRTLLTRAAGEAAERQSRYEDLLRQAPEHSRAGLDGLLQYLFPEVRRGRETHEHPDLWRDEKRVCSPEHFSRYFELGIPARTVSETEVLFLRRRFGNPEGVAEFLRNYLNDGRLAALLAQIPTQPRIVSESDARSLLLGLWMLEPEIDCGDSSDCDETRAIALELGRDLLRDVIEPSRRTAFLDDVVAATQARAFPTALLGELEREPFN